MIISADAISEIVHSRNNHLISSLEAGLQNGTIKYFSGEKSLIFDNDPVVEDRMKPFRAGHSVSRDAKVRTVATHIYLNLEASGENVADLIDSEVELAAAARVHSVDVICAAAGRTHNPSLAMLVEGAGRQAHTPTDAFS
jgi:hypothetical protein